MSDKLEKRIYLSPPHMSGREIEYVNQAFADNWIVPLGPNVNEFEKRMVDYLGGGLFAVAMTSGTAAIHIALRLLNVKAGDEVFCSSATFVATANPILYEKAIPVFIDSEPETWNICPKALLKAIKEKKKQGRIPKILICADLFGMSANYVAIEKICNSYDIQIIEDSAESLGSTYLNKKCARFGRFGILSFNGNKIITTSGGGMLITHLKEEAEKALYLITQARDKAPYYLHSEVGYNYRLSNVCAGIGLGQLDVIEERVLSRRRNYYFYKKYLENTPLVFRTEGSDYCSNHWLSTALISETCSITPQEVIAYLNEFQIEARRVWKPLHTQPLFQKNEFFSVSEVPVAEMIFNKGICLPSGSAMSEQTLEYVSRTIQNIFHR